MQKSDKINLGNSLLHQVAKNIKAENLIQPEDRVLAAVSGGPDSVALLHILKVLPPRMFQKLSVAHLNHSIRPGAADSDAEFVSDLCRKLDLSFHLKKIDVPAYARQEKLNLEEAGRICRYRFLKTLAKDHGYTKIALAHHADDNAESILMYLLRGSGPLGISGMPSVREKIFIRPLLKVTRGEIIDFITTNRLQHVIDDTNLDIKQTRNRIRHCLVPVLKKDFNPKIITALNTLAEVIQNEDEWMSAASEPFFIKALLEKRPQALTLSSAELNNMHAAIARRVLRRALFEIKGDLRRIGLRHVDSILSLAAEPLKGYRQLHLPDKILVESENNKLQLRMVQRKPRQFKIDQTENSEISFNYCVDNPGQTPIQIHIAETGCYIKFSSASLDTTSFGSDTGQNTVFFDMDRLKFPLTVRNPKPGDRFSPLGMKGTQKLKNYFINAKIPLSMRRRIPIVESEEKIIWIAGYRCSHFSRVTPETDRVLKAEFFLPNTQQ